MKPLLSYITPRNIASFLLVLFCIQYIPIESRGGVSIIKVGISLLCPFCWFIHTPKINKALLLLLCYFVFVCLTASFYPNTFRISTLLFLLSHIFVFLTYYNYVWMENVFNIDSFIRLIQKFINVYTIVLIIQQCFIIVGIKYFPLINLSQPLDRGIGANSLSYEPSSFAITISVLFLSLLRLYEIKYSRKITISELFYEARWVCIGFLWSILTMGSGTAIIALGILACYFLRGTKSIIIISLFIFIYWMIPMIDFTPLQRAYNSFNALLTFDTNNIKQTDSSAAYRLVPLANTLTNLDLSNWQAWFGYGIDSIKANDYFNAGKMIGGIREYGLVSFIIAQLFVFKCCIRKFFSLETLMWIGLFNMSLNNIPFYWGAIMIFSTTNYFYKRQNTYEQ